MSNKKAKYFVCSESEEPTIIYFSFEAAVASAIEYIDAFDEDGKKVSSYKYVADGVYTTNF